MMARDLARALDPVLLAEDCGLTPDAWQADLLRAMPRRALLLCSRQSGKSTVTALVALWTAIYARPPRSSLSRPANGSRPSCSGLSWDFTRGVPL